MKRKKYKKKNDYLKIKKLIFLLTLLLVFIMLYKFLINHKRNQSISTLVSSDTTISKNSVTTSFLEDTEIKQLLESIIAKNNLTENNFAIFYFNKTNNKYYFYNEYTFFSGASTVKVPISMYYYDMINNNILKAHDKLLYSRSCYEPGSGLTDYTYSIGEYIPINFLLKQSIVNSDNTAVNILINNIGYNTYRRSISKYTDDSLPNEFFSTNIISASCAFDFINYLYEHMDNYKELISDMKQSSMNLYLKKYLQDYEVAHKYGSYNGYLHDYGIVFGKDTYLIGIFTKNIPNADELIANINLDILNYTLK